MLFFTIPYFVSPCFKPFDILPFHVFLFYVLQIHVLPSYVLPINVLLIHVLPVHVLPFHICLIQYFTNQSVLLLISGFLIRSTFRGRHPFSKVANKKMCLNVFSPACELNKIPKPYNPMAIGKTD